jgi:MSHA biogenesis protein MshQ
VLRRIIFINFIIFLLTPKQANAVDASVADIIVNSGTTATFTISLSAASPTDVVINYATQDGTASAGSDYTSTSSAVTISAGGSTLDQYAISVDDFSSEWSFDGPEDYRAVQVLGAPDTNSYGDIKTAWSPENENGNTEHITVSFGTSVYASGVTIRETWGNGFVTQIDVVDLSNTLHTVWSGIDPSSPGSPVDFLATWPQTSYLVNGIKITTDTDHNLSTWEEIDSIQLHGLTAGPTSAQFSVNTSTTAADGESFNVLITSADANVLTSSAKATFLSGTQCAAVYTGGLQASSTSATWEFKNNSQLLNNPTSTLPAGSISTNHSGSCGASQCTASGTANDSLDIPSFQSWSTGPKVEVNGSQTVGASENEFEEILVIDGGALNFSTNQSTYIIEKLELENNTTINFSPGDYFIAEFKVDKNDIVINVVGSGTVRIWSTKDIKFKDDALVNSPSYGSAGSPSKLFMHTTKKVKLENNATVSAFVAAKDFEMKSDTFYFGGATVTNKVKLSNEATVTWIAGELENTDLGDACGGNINGLDHFTMNHDGTGLNCVAETIVVTAKNTLGSVLTDYAGGITLDTQSAKGTWNLVGGSGSLADTTGNDGLASYSFVDADNGVAQFSLSYLEGASSINIDAYQTSNSLFRDDDTEGNLVFSPSGFTFTQSVLSNPPPSPINDQILTQTSGSNFNVHLAVYGQTEDDPDCGIIEAYTGDKNLAFWFDYEDPNSGSISTTIDNVGIAASEGASTTQIVSFTDGQASVIGKYKDVGQIQIHAKDNAILGASKSFVVRPSDLVIVDIETASGTNNPAAASATGLGFVAAGDAFTVVVESRDAEGSITPNFGNEASTEGIEIISSTLMLPAGVNGSANDGFIENNSNFTVSGTAGRFSGSNFSWNEVGIIKLQASIADDDYLGTGEVTGTESGNVGRFYPATFDLTSGFTSSSCAGFVYMDQNAITANYILQARGAAGNILFNYDLSLLGAGGVVSPVFYAENNNQGTNLISRVPVATSFWNNGVYSLSSSTYTFTRLGSVDGPYENLVIGVSVSDSLDGQVISSPDMNASTATGCGALANCDAAAFSGSVSVRFGRLEVPNAFGPETQILDVPLRTTYFDGSGFVVNTDDICTSYINTGASLSDYLLGLPVVTVTSPTVLTSLISGETAVTEPLYLSAPGAGNDGSVDVTYDAPIWLEYNWNDAGDVDPTGTASFGHFRGHDRVIYWREIFN